MLRYEKTSTESSDRVATFLLEHLSSMYCLVRGITQRLTTRCSRADRTALGSSKFVGPRCYRAIETCLVNAYTETLRSFLSHEKKQTGTSSSVVLCPTHRAIRCFDQSRRLRRAIHSTVILPVNVGILSFLPLHTNSGRSGAQHCCRLTCTWNLDPPCPPIVPCGLLYLEPCLGGRPVTIKHPPQISTKHFVVLNRASPSCARREKPFCRQGKTFET